MIDNAETDPEIISATAADGRNAILNVSKQESLGLITAGAAPAFGTSGGSSGTSGGWVNFQAAEAVAIPGQYSESPVYTGGSGGGGGNTGNPGNGGYGGGNNRVDPIDDPFGDDPFGPFQGQQTF